MQKVCTVTAWLKCILQEFGTLYWTVTEIGAAGYSTKWCLCSYSFLLRWMTGIQRSAGRCQGRQPAVGGVWKPSCLCNSTMFCHTASQLTPSLTRCLLYDLLLLAWSSSTLFLQVHSRCLTYGPVRLPSTSLVNFVCNFWSSFVDVLLWFFGVQVLLYGFVWIFGLVLEKCLQCFDAVGWAAGRASGL